MSRLDRVAESNYKLATDSQDSQQEWNSAVSAAKAAANVEGSAAMPTPPAGVNWNFIAANEGPRTHGYVPLDNNGEPYANSGVTIAIGFDLGGKTVADLKKLGLPHDLVTKLAPYLGKQGQTAQNYLNVHPLSITKSQEQQIDTRLFTSFYNQVALNYNKAETTGTRFQHLPRDAQTAIVDLAYQYGTNLAGATPSFWKQVTTGQWKEAYDNLLNFGDNFPTRRHKEAALLNDAIKAGTLPAPHRPGRHTVS